MMMMNTLRHPVVSLIHIRLLYTTFFVSCLFIKMSVCEVYVLSLVVQFYVMQFC